MNSRASLRYQKMRLEYVICIYDILKTFLYVAENNVVTRPHPFAFSSLHNVIREIHLFLHGDHTATHNASIANTTLK